MLYFPRFHSGTKLGLIARSHTYETSVISQIQLGRFCAAASSQGLFNYLSLFFLHLTEMKVLVSEFLFPYNFAFFFYFCLAPSSSLQRWHLEKKAPVC